MSDSQAMPSPFDDALAWSKRDVTMLTASKKSSDNKIFFIIIGIIFFLLLMWLLVSVCSGSKLEVKKLPTGTLKSMTDPRLNINPVSPN